jgi:hypothetical protein
LKSSGVIDKDTQAVVEMDHCLGKETEQESKQV